MNRGSLTFVVLAALAFVRAQAPQPWETPQGRACIDRWAAVTAAKLNAYQGGQEHNGRKPWNFHPQYGTLQGNPQTGPISNAAPVDFVNYGYNKHWYMYANWIPVAAGGYWLYPAWNAAAVESIQSFVPKCLAGASKASTVSAVDDDPENKLWDCASQRVPYGDKSADKLRCLSFRYEVPSEGITSATLHVAVTPLDADPGTDSIVAAVGQSFPNCAPVQGQMAGCVTLHGGFQRGKPSLDLDLFHLTCDPSIAGAVTPEAQQAVVAQLRTGVLHLLLQDDTAAHSAQLVLNGGPLTVPCGTSED